MSDYSKVNLDPMILQLMHKELVDFIKDGCETCKTFDELIIKYCEQIHPKNSELPVSELTNSRIVRKYISRALNSIRKIHLLKIRWRPDRDYNKLELNNVIELFVQNFKLESIATPFNSKEPFNTTWLMELSHTLSQVLGRKPSNIFNFYIKNYELLFKSLNIKYPGIFTNISYNINSDKYTNSNKNIDPFKNNNDESPNTYNPGLLNVLYSAIKNSNSHLNEKQIIGIANKITQYNTTKLSENQKTITNAILTLVTSFKLENIIVL